MAYLSTSCSYLLRRTSQNAVSIEEVRTRSALSEYTDDSPVFHRPIIAACSPWLVLHTPPDTPDSLVRHRQRRRGARIVARLLAQAAVSVALLASVWWGVHTLGVHTLATEGPSSEAWLRPVYVGGCPIGPSGLSASPPERGCSEEGPSHPSGSRRPGAGLDERAHRAQK